VLLLAHSGRKQHVIIDNRAIGKNSTDGTANCCTRCLSQTTHNVKIRVVLRLFVFHIRLTIARKTS